MYCSTHRYIDNCGKSSAITNIISAGLYIQLLDVTTHFIFIGEIFENAVVSFQGSYNRDQVV